MTQERIKEIIARILYVGSIGLLAVYFVALVVSFAIALHDRRIPAGWWIRDAEHHGPWRHYEPVRTLFNIAQASLLSGALMSSTNAKLMKGWRPVWVLTIALCMAIFHGVFLFWLTA